MDRCRRDAPAAGAPRRPRPPEPRPLQQFNDGAVISGVCLGLARYFGLNATALRVFVVLLLQLSGGGVILLYVALMLLMPFAPLSNGGPPLRWLPQKRRSITEFPRARLHFATTGSGRLRPRRLS